MTNSQASGLNIDARMLKVGGTLAGVGILLATAGLGLASLSMSRAAFEWLKRREISPTAVAVDRLHQAQHASAAGLHAWRTNAHSAPRAGRG